MKQLIICLLFLFNFCALLAQSNVIKIGVGKGILAYEHEFATNVELQYEYKLNPRLSVFLGAGTSGKNMNISGTSSGTDGDVTWNKAWEYEFSERFNYADLGFKYRLFKLFDRYEMKALIGGTMAQSKFNFPEYIFINRGVIEERNDVLRNSKLGLMLFGLENNVYISDRFLFSLSVIFRTTFKEKYIITREIRTHNALITSTSGILNVANMNLQFGYLF